MFKAYQEHVKQPPGSYWILNLECQEVSHIQTPLYTKMTSNGTHYTMPLHIHKLGHQNL